MNESEYIQTQQQLLCLVGIIKDMPLKEFLHKINICESVSPLIDPTLYMQGADKLTLIKRIAESARSFQNDVIKYEQALLKSRPACKPSGSEEEMKKIKNNLISAISLIVL